MRSISRRNRPNKLKKEQGQRPFVNFSAGSQIGVLNNKQKSNNQDTYFAISELGKNKSQALFGVCDGHGLFGHYTSQEIKEELPKILQSLINDERNQIEFDKLLKESIIKMNNHIIDKPSLNTDYSGSTLITVLLVNDVLYCANVGDSRAVLCRYMNEQFIAIPLSSDHKLTEYSERRRIERLGGRVDPIYTPSGAPVGPLRVYLGVQNIPGLAMSRSIGDKKVTEIGVIPDPDISKLYVTNDDKFIIIASDGL